MLRTKKDFSRFALEKSADLQALDNFDTCLEEMSVSQHLRRATATIEQLLAWKSFVLGYSWEDSKLWKP